MRAEFEVWAEEHNLGITLAAASATGLYTRNLAWTAWRTAYQAGQKAEQAEVERLRHEVEFLKENRDAFMLLAGRMISDDSKLDG